MTLTATDSAMLIAIGMCLMGFPVAITVLVTIYRERRQPPPPPTSADPDVLRAIAADLARMSAQVKAMAQPPEQAPEPVPVAQEGVPANA